MDGLPEAVRRCCVVMARGERSHTTEVRDTRRGEQCRDMHEMHCCLCKRLFHANCTFTCQHAKGRRNAQSCISCMQRHARVLHACRLCQLQQTAALADSQRPEGQGGRVCAQGAVLLRGWLLQPVVVNRGVSCRGQPAGQGHAMQLTGQGRATQHWAAALPNTWVCLAVGSWQEGSFSPGPIPVQPEGHCGSHAMQHWAAAPPNIRLQCCDRQRWPGGPHKCYPPSLSGQHSAAAGRYY